MFYPKYGSGKKEKSRYYLIFETGNIFLALASIDTT
jgi:hypothetical protein